jgi:hypothetical protein
MGPRAARWRSALLLAMVAAASPASADFTFPLTSLVVGHEPVTFTLDASLVPPGEYSGYRVRTNWSPVANGPWSREARWQLLDPSLPVPLANSGVAANGLDSSTPLLLRWAGDFVTTYTGESPLTLRAWQTLPTSVAAWDSLTITLLSGAVPTPTEPAALDWGFLNPSGRADERALTSRGVLWYRFETPAVRAAEGEFLRIDTLGSLLAGGEFGDGNDTEIALYDSRGLRVAFNDDLDTAGGQLLSGLTFGRSEVGDPPPAGDLPAGLYFLAVAGFDAVFADAAFDVSSTSPVTGAVRVRLATNVPEPAGVVFLGAMAAAVGGGRTKFTRRMGKPACTRC